MAGTGEKRANIADFRLSVDGNDFSDKARPRLVSITLTEQRGEESDQLDIVLDDTDGKLALPKKGAEIVLQLGWLQGADVSPGLVDKGKFKVDNVEWGGPPDQVTIRARAANLTGGFRARREKAHKDTTLGKIAREVADANGYEAKVSPELDEIAVPVLAQHQKSDMALLRQLGREHDAVATVKDRKLVLAPIGKAASITGKALPLLELTRADLADYRYSEIERSADAGVEARWHDQSSGERKTVQAGGSVTAPEGKEPRRLRRVYHSQAKAEQAAKAAAAKAKRAEKSMDVTIALGRPDLVLEQPVKLSGLKDAIDAGSWILAELTTTLDGNGLASKLKLEPKG